MNRHFPVRHIQAQRVKPVAALANGIKVSLVLTACLTTLLHINDLTAEAKKKADAGPDPAAVAAEALKKDIGPLCDKITQFMVKEESMLLLSPKEAGELAELKFKLMDLMNDNPQNPLLAKPLYQGAVLMTMREEYDDAHNFFSYVAQNYPTTPYGMKSKLQVSQLEKRFGADHFADSTAVIPSAASSTPNAASASPATTPSADPKVATSSATMATAKK
jgi:TolA-binding protein